MNNIEVLSERKESNKMILHYIKFSVNRILKNLAFSWINMFGLAIGVVSFIVLFIHVHNEKSFDKHFKDYKDIYRVVSQPAGSDVPWARSLGFIKGASASIPEILDATQFSHCSKGTIKIGDHSFQQEDIMSVDESFIQIFEVESVLGNLDEISDPNTAFVSEDFAKKYFEGENPIGKTINIESLQYVRDLGAFEIRGVVKNTQPKTHFNYEILLSQNGALQQRYEILPKRKIQWVYNYLKIEKNASTALICDKLLSSYMESGLAEERGPREYIFSLIQVSNIHLKSNFKFELKGNSSKINISLFLIISFVILLVSLMNFINLNIAKLISRLSELGFHRVIGARKRNLIEQVLVDMFIQTIIVIIISLFALELLIPTINQFFEIDFNIYYSEPFIYFVILGVIVLCGVLTTLFLAYFLLGKATIIKLLSGISHISGSLVLKTLLVLQMLVVVVLIISTIIVNEQIGFISNKYLGFDKENVIVVHLKDFSKDPTIFSNQLMKQSQIKSVGFTNQHFGYPAQNFSLEGLGIEGSAEFVFANYNYLNTMNIQLVHNWIPSANDTVEGMLLNEHLYKRLMEKHGSIEALEAFYNQQELEEGSERIQFIGVVKDFNYNSIHDAIGDFAFYLGESRNRARFIHIRTNPDELNTALTEIQKTWDIHYPGQEFNYFFLDDIIAKQYKAETILGRILLVFSILSILISIVGISALSLFISRKRTKEIGVRKVNGATTLEILFLFYLDAIKWLAIAFVFASPIAYLAMYKWLENFAYKTKIEWWVFLVSGLVTLVITLITVSWQTYKAARRNPVEALRYE